MASHRTDPGRDRDRTHPPAAYDDWSLPKGKLDPGETTGRRGPREVEEETGFHARLGPAARDPGRLRDPVDHRKRQEGRLLGGRMHSVASSCQQRGRRAPVAAARGGDDRRELSARYGKVMRRFLRVASRHHHRARSSGTARPDDGSRLQGRRPNASARQARAGPGRVAGRPAPCVRCDRSIRPIASAVSRRWNRWPRSWASSIVQEPALTEEAYADDPARPRVTASLEDRRARRRPVICSQGKVIPDLIAGGANETGSTLTCPQPEGQHLGAVVGRRHGWWPPTTSTARCPKNA